MKDINFLGTIDGVNHGNNNDLQYGPDGDFITTELSDRLKQDMTKILLTEVGENKVFSGYGAGLQTLISSGLSPENVKGAIVNSVVYAFSYLNEMNKGFDDSERIKNINNIQIKYSTSDPRAIYIRIEVVDMSDKVVSLTIGG